MKDNPFAQSTQNTFKLNKKKKKPFQVVTLARAEGQNKYEQKLSSSGLLLSCASFDLPVFINFNVYLPEIKRRPKKKMLLLHSISNGPEWSTHFWCLNFIHKWMNENEEEKTTYKINV